MDIEGLRAIAVVFVLASHAASELLPGGFIGVDVFFVVSGFLMTGILHRELSSTGGLRVSSFYARRARRLVPASALVLLTTALAALTVLPDVRWGDIGLDIASASAYVVNWTLAAREVDYLSWARAPSPLQHFWSLSVEEQFYVLWPVLLAAVATVCRRAGLTAARVTGPLLGATFVLSLGWSVALTVAAPSRAYFVTTTRLWELALGGLVAWSLPRWAALPPRRAALLSWLGVAVIAISALGLRVDRGFPGWVALAPTLATALVIGVGSVSGPGSFRQACARGPIRWLGETSYSLYLWHWPVLVVGGYAVTQGVREPSALEGTLLVLGSAIPARLSYSYVENPLRRSQRMATDRPALWLAVFGVAMGVAVGAGLVFAGGDAELERPQVGPSAMLPGAAALGSDPGASPAAVAVDAIDVMHPRPRTAAHDFSNIYAADSNLVFADVTPKPHVSGATGSPTEVVLVGDSHAAHWHSALEPVARARGWKLVSHTKNECPFLDVPISDRAGGVYAQCQSWVAAVAGGLSGPSKPAAVFVSYGPPAPVTPSGELLEGNTRERAIVEGARALWAPLIAQGTAVIVLRDTPRFPFHVPDCIAGHPGSLTRCTTPRATALQLRDQTQPAAVAAVPGAQLVDLTDFICPRDPCAPIIGGVVVYVDNNHVTASYMRTLAPRLGRALEIALPDLR